MFHNSLARSLTEDRDTTIGRVHGGKERTRCMLAAVASIQPARCMSAEGEMQQERASGKRGFIDQDGDNRIQITQLFMSHRLAKADQTI